MHRNKLLSSLDKYKHKNSDESVVVEEFVSFVKSHSDCFERSLKVGHLTGSCVLLNPTEDNLLMTHHGKLNRWIQLGGHADGDTDMLEVSLKEAQEESGIGEIQVIVPEILDIDIHTIPANSKDGEHLHFDVRYLLKASTEDFKLSDESLDLRWFSFNEALSVFTEPSMHRMIKKAQVTVL